MKCIEISKPGGPEVLVPAERATPTPKADEILVKVEKDVQQLFDSNKGLF